MEHFSALIYIAVTLFKLHKLQEGLLDMYWDASVSAVISQYYWKKLPLLLSQAFPKEVNQNLTLLFFHG